MHRPPQDMMRQMQGRPGEFPGGAMPMRMLPEARERFENSEQWIKGMQDGSHMMPPFRGEGAGTLPPGMIGPGMMPPAMMGPDASMPSQLMPMQEGGVPGYSPPPAGFAPPPNTAPLPPPPPPPPPSGIAPFIHLFGALFGIFAR